ncbi:MULTISPECIES: hypothetical protein [unclassified Mucilaginibacter]|uniref:hypothetical protein n=1 Tax=unclassified Mucilaginibacter TaxID=2617802 RepID=UPI0031F6E887
MTDSFKNTTDGKYEFTLNYSERELTCHVEREGDILHVHIDNNINADLELLPDGTIRQLSGSELPESNLDYIRRMVLDDGNIDSGKGSGI